MKTKALLKNYYVFIRDFATDLFDDKLGHYASSLSWSTLFTLIPLLVIFISVFTNLPLFNTVYAKIEELIFSNLIPTNSKEVMNYLNTFVANSDKLGVMGAGYVLFAAFMFFKNYDFIVNDIFEEPTRGLYKGLKTYFLLILLIPLLMGGSFYVSSFLQQSITQTIHLYYFLPYLIVWMMFYIAYQISPNTSVTFTAASISSFIASLVWYLSKNAFVFYVLYNRTYTSIYGSISTMLFFFLWIYISWAIFIHGLKFCALLNKDEEIDHIV